MAGEPNIITSVLKNDLNKFVILTHGWYNPSTFGDFKNEEKWNTIFIETGLVDEYTFVHANAYIVALFIDPTNLLYLFLCDGKDKGINKTYTDKEIEPYKAKKNSLQEYILRGKYDEIYTELEVPKNEYSMKELEYFEKVIQNITIYLPGQQIYNRSLSMVSDVPEKREEWSGVYNKKLNMLKEKDAFSFDGGEKEPNITNTKNILAEFNNDQSAKLVFLISCSSFENNKIKSIFKEERLRLETYQTRLRNTFYEERDNNSGPSDIEKVKDTSDDLLPYTTGIWHLDSSGDLIFLEENYNKEEKPKESNRVVNSNNKNNNNNNNNSLNNTEKRNGIWDRKIYTPDSFIYISYLKGMTFTLNIYSFNVIIFNILNTATLNTLYLVNKNKMEELIPVKKIIEKMGITSIKQLIEIREKKTLYLEIYLSIFTESILSPYQKPENPNDVKSIDLPKSIERMNSNTQIKEHMEKYIISDLIYNKIHSIFSELYNGNNSNNGEPPKHIDIKDIRKNLENIQKRFPNFEVWIKESTLASGSKRRLTSAVINFNDIKNITELGNLKLLDKLEEIKYALNEEILKIAKSILTSPRFFHIGIKPRTPRRKKGGSRKKLYKMNISQTRKRSRAK